MGGVNAKAILPHSITLSVSSHERYALQDWQHGFRCWSYVKHHPRAMPFPYQMLDTTDPDRMNPKLATIYMMLKQPAQIMPSTSTHALISPKNLLHPELDDFQAYIMAIPRQYRQLAIQCPKHHFIALEAMRDIDGFVDFLQQEQQQGGMHYVLSVWQLAKVRDLPRHFRLQIATDMLKTSRTCMIASIIDLTCKKPFLRLCKKIPAADIKHDVLWALLDMYQQPNIQLALSSLPVLTAHALKSFAEIPPWMVSVPLFRVLHSAFQTFKTFQSIMPPALMTIEESLQPRFRHALMQAKDILSLEHIIHNWANNWADKLLMKKRFPKLPCQSTDRLCLLSSPQQLKEEGEIMQHCVAAYIDAVVERRSYFFAWHGTTRATVQLISDAGHWLWHEVLGKNNASFPSADMPSLIDDLASVFKGGLLLCYTHIAGQSYYDFAKAVHELKNHDLLLLRHEKNNAYDPNAIEIITQSGLKLGYIPRNKNHIIVQWLKMGINVQAKLHIEVRWHIDVFVQQELSQKP